MLELALIAAVGGTSMGLRIWKRHSRLQLWRLAAKASGLQIEKRAGPWPRPAEVQALAGPLKVSIGQSGGKDSLIVIEVPGPPGFPEVTIRPRALRPPVYGFVSGDPLLDRELAVEGPLQLVRALLDAEARQLLLKVRFLGRLELVRGQLRAEMDAAATLNLLPILLAIARRFAQPLDVVQRLADNARKDPEAGVRVQNLFLLARELPGDPRTLETLRAACSDATPFVRLRAAKELGAEGRGIVVAFAESTEEDVLSAEALSFLDPDLPFERVRAILDQASRGRLLRTVRACLQTLSRSGDAADVEALAKVLEQEDGELAAAAAEALGTTGSPAAEPALILALRREPMGLQVAAANALARIGSPAAVLPLKEAAESFHFAQDLRKAARQAIAAIQGRLPGASPGQLSLAGADVGNLSLAQAEGGELSLAADPAGRLDLTEREEG